MAVKKRTLILAMLVLLGVVTFLDRINISVAGSDIMRDLNISPDQWGWILSAFILSYGLMQIPMGAWGDKRGHRGVLTLIVLWWSAFTIFTGMAQGFIGLLLVLKPVWFAKIFIFVLAAAIIVFCVIQLMALISTLQYIDAAPLPLVLCGAALIGGIVVMFFSAGQVICYILGVLLVIYGVSELLAMPKIKKAEEIYIIKYGPAKDAKETEETKKEPSGLLVTGVKDAEYEEVK